MDTTTSAGVDYTIQLNNIQSTLDSINAGIQLQDRMFYIFMVIIFTILVCCLLYKVLKIFI